MRLFGLRQLDEYPEGLRRLWLLAMAVLAVLIGSYEAQIAPVVPLLLRDLGIDLKTYGTVAAVAAVAGALAAVVGGRLTDHLGRVRLLVPLMMVTALCCFAMTLVDSTRDLLLARAVLAFVDGMAIASTAPLVRDFSPRTGRAQAFGFWTWGPVGASLLAAGLAAWTLPVFQDSWRSQFVLMGLVSLVMSLVIAGNIADLSPELRARIQQSERAALPARHQAGTARARDLLTHRRLWVHGVGISLWLVLYLTLAMYGPTMLVSSFDVSSAKASGIMTAFWGSTWSCWSSSGASPTGCRCASRSRSAARWPRRSRLATSWSSWGARRSPPGRSWPPGRCSAPHWRSRTGHGWRTTPRTPRMPIRGCRAPPGAFSAS